MNKPATALLMLANLPVAAFAQIVPASFRVPTEHATPTYRLVPLGPQVATLDYQAYMSSIDHIRAKMGGDWPKPGLTMEDQARDMAGEKAEWEGRKSFPFAVLTVDRSKELGCFYIRPSKKMGYDAVASLWTTKEQADGGLDKRLYRDMKAWLKKDWPFRKVAWPGIELSQAEWKALRDKP
jgi:hypothetical protein